MRLLHYLEIENFKRFGDKQRIELDHPAVLIGPNNCGKTTAIQAIALWSQAVKTWYDAKGRAPPKKRTSTSLNRLKIVSVPVQRTRYFWHNTNVRRGNSDIHLVVTVGVLHKNKVAPVTMKFRNHGEDLVYCAPNEETLKNPEVIKAAAEIGVELLYPMSGLEAEEPILRVGRIDVLLGQGQTAQALRNLCLIVYKNNKGDWNRIVRLMRRLFGVRIGTPQETSRGSIDLFYEQDGATAPLDVALAGRGFQQMLLIFAYLYSHRGSVVLIDEPDAHLEILRQRQVYVMLREIAEENKSQVIMVTHSEVILNEALGHNLTLLVGGSADNLAAKKDIMDALKHYGTEHYVRAVQRGYVLYLEGNSDLEILRALARRMNHIVAGVWDRLANVFYVQDNYPSQDLDAELARVEGGFGGTPNIHYFSLRRIVPGLAGLAILDSDGSEREDFEEEDLRFTYWKRYEIENYFVTPEVLRKHARKEYSDLPLFGQNDDEINETLEGLILEFVFKGNEQDFATWAGLDANASLLVWDARTERLKLSDFAEEFYRRLAGRLGFPMLLRKGELHRLIDFVDPATIPAEVGKKLDALAELFANANPGEDGQ